MTYQLDSTLLQNTSPINYGGSHVPYAAIAIVTSFALLQLFGRDAWNALQRARGKHRDHKKISRHSQVMRAMTEFNDGWSFPEEREPRDAA